MPPTEREPETWPLTAGVARGDEVALGRFYDLWFGRVLSTARAVTRRDESFCLDVVQDAMLRVARRMPRLPNEPAVRAWMARTVTRVAVDRLRAETRRRVREQQAASAEQDGRADGLATAAEQERFAWLQDALARLPERDRALLQARFGEGATLAAAGAAVGTTGHAAHGRIRRLLAALRRAAGEAFGDE